MLFVVVLLRLLVKLILSSIYLCVLDDSLICDCDGAEILRPQHFVVVCEHTSIHNILSRTSAGKNIIIIISCRLLVQKVDMLQYRLSNCVDLQPIF